MFALMTVDWIALLDRWTRPAPPPTPNLPERVYALAWAEVAGDAPLPDSFSGRVLWTEGWHQLHHGAPTAQLATLNGAAEFAVAHGWSAGHGLEWHLAVTEAQIRVACDWTVREALTASLEGTFDDVWPGALTDAQIAWRLAARWRRGEAWTRARADRILACYDP